MKFKIRVNAPAILGFVEICFVVMLLSMIAGDFTKRIFITWHSSLTSPLTYLQFFIHVLGRADWSHFFGIMVYILLLGPMLEEKYGRKRILQVMVITAFMTGVINYMFFWHVAICGASGICFAFIILSSFTGVKEKEIPLTFIIVSAIFIGQQIYEGIAYDDNISKITHIVGGIVGGISGYLLNNMKNHTPTGDQHV